MKLASRYLHVFIILMGCFAVADCSNNTTIEVFCSSLCADYIGACYGPNSNECWACAPSLYLLQRNSSGVCQTKSQHQIAFYELKNDAMDLSGYFSSKPGPKSVISTLCRVSTRPATSFRKLSLVSRSTITKWWWGSESATLAHGIRLTRCGFTLTGSSIRGLTTPATTRKICVVLRGLTASRSSSASSLTIPLTWLCASQAQFRRLIPLSSIGESRTWPSGSEPATANARHASVLVMPTA